MQSSVTERRDISFSAETMQKILLVLLCLMSLQPLVGVFAKLYDANDMWGTLTALQNFYLQKAQYIRIIGYLCLVVGVINIVMNKQNTIAASIRRCFSHKPWNVFFLLLFGWIVVNAFTVAPDLTIALAGDSSRYEGVFSIVAYVGFFAVASQLTNEKYKTIWINFTIGVACVLAVMAIYAFKAENPIVLSYMTHFLDGYGSVTIQATFPHYNHFGYYLCMMIVLTSGMALRANDKIKRVCYLPALALLEYVLATNGTRGAMIGVIFGVGFLSAFCWMRKETSAKMILLIWGVIILASLPATGFLSRFSSIFLSAGGAVGVESFAENVDMGNGRLTLWKDSILLIKQKPITGFGINMSYYYLQLVYDIADMPHNEYLQYAVDLGIPGLLLYIGALVSLFVHSIKKIKQLPVSCILAGCAAIAYGVSAFFGVSLVQVIPFYFILLGFVKWEETGSIPEKITKEDMVDQTIEDEENHET